MIRVACIVSGGFLTFTSAMSAYVFWLMLRNGGVTIIEGDLSILRTELSFAIVLVIAGAVSFAIGILRR